MRNGRGTEIRVLLTTFRDAKISPQPLVLCSVRALLPTETHHVGCASVATRRRAADVRPWSEAQSALARPGVAAIPTDGAERIDELDATDAAAALEAAADGMLR